MATCLAIILEYAVVTERVGDAMLPQLASASLVCKARYYRTRETSRCRVSRPSRQNNATNPVLAPC